MELAFKIVIAFFVVVLAVGIIGSILGIVGSGIADLMRSVPWWVSVGSALVLLFAVVDYDARVQLAVFLAITVLVVSGFLLFANYRKSPPGDRRETKRPEDL